MKDPDELNSVLKNLPGISIKKSYYRFIGIKYLKDPLSALGSKKNGGRYNFKDAFEVLYIAPDPQTAVQETLQNINFRFPPKAIITIDVEVQEIINLKDEKTINTLGIYTEKLHRPWRKFQDIEGKESYTQTLGKSIYEAQKFEGIQYPSAKVKGKYNLAIFPERLKKGSLITVYDPDKLLEQYLKG